MNELGNQFGSAIIVAQLIEYLKNSNWFPFISRFNSARYKAIIGCIGAVVTTIGISYTFDYSATNGGSLILHLPSLHVLIDFAKQWAFQEFVYNAGVKDKA